MGLINKFDKGTSVNILRFSVGVTCGIGWFEMEWPIYLEVNSRAHTQNENYKQSFLITIKVHSYVRRIENQYNIILLWLELVYSFADLLLQTIDSLHENIEVQISMK